MAKADVWYGGELVRWGDANASLLCHGMQRGALVFDVGALRLGTAGEPLLFRPREHIVRFLRSAELIGLDIRWDEGALFEATLQTVRASLKGGHVAGLVRWSAFVPTVEADVVPRAGIRASVCIAVIRPEDTVTGTAAAPPRPAWVRVTVPSDVRKAGPEVFPPQAKVAASYLGPMLAKRHALATGFDEVVLLDGHGRLAEAPTANVFVVKNGVIATPPVERVLAGITRDTVLAFARAAGATVRETHLSPEDLCDADEAFLTATSLPVQPIASVDGRVLRAGAPGPVTAELKSALAACERGADARFPEWAVPVP
jgi:branched-chain amino acid aminotransferase